MEFGSECTLTLSLTAFDHLRFSRTEVRPIDGFVYAICPFNFTALAVNLVLAPIIVGNVVMWKPSPGAIYSSWLLNQIMIEAGLPAGVLQFLPGDAELVTEAVFSSRDLGGLHFTGSTAVFKRLLARVGAKVDTWKSYPRFVGETGEFPALCYLFSATGLPIQCRRQELPLDSPIGGH